MKTLTINEATSNLADVLQQAIKGEEIAIRSGSSLVVLRPQPAVEQMAKEQLDPREALRRLQNDAHLSAADAEAYLEELRAERLAAEDRGAA